MLCRCWGSPSVDCPCLSLSLLTFGMWALQQPLAYRIAPGSPITLLCASTWFPDLGKNIMFLQHPHVSPPFCTMRVGSWTGRQGGQAPNPQLLQWSLLSALGLLLPPQSQGVPNPRPPALRAHVERGRSWPGHS